MSEDYSLSADFTHDLNSGQLEQEINNSNITINLVGINTCGDLVQIVFESLLGTDDKTLLNAIVSAHTPNALHICNYVKLSINRTSNLSEYELIYSFTVNDSYKLDILKLAITAKLTGSISSYDIRIYDNTNNKIIACASFNNPTFDLMDMGELSFVPSDQAMLEVHCKKVGGDVLDKVIINELTIYAH